jgi:class 3 adenylate cyclase/tetratricopeptide (TPR) repeat protein
VATLTCSRCDTPNRPGRKFCGSCGTALGSACPSCGTTNEPGELFCGECGTRLDGRDSDPTPEVRVERRLVSVLFLDLVGSTSLSVGRDAEDVRDLLTRYFELSAGVIGRYGGQVEKFIGDAVMAVWGTPVTREDDAERAVRAALELVSGVSEFGREIEVLELAARAAVLTGEAAVNLGAAGQAMVAGELPNLASRAQSAAEPGTVLVGESTRWATESSIAYADAGVHELRGKDEPLPLWRALRVTGGRRGEMKEKRLEPPFVGRDRHLHLLKELFHSGAEESKGHLVSIVGIAGIGKSRLAWELYKYLDGIAQDVAWQSGRCLAYGEGVTYWALAEMVRTRAEIAEGEQPEAARTKLDAALGHYVPDDDERDWIRPRIAQLLSLEASEHLERADLFAGWRLFFERVADLEPVVLVFEDMQWADPPLLEFVEHLLDRSRTSAIFVVALARPELGDRHPSWPAGLRNATTLALEPLPTSAMEALVDGFVPGLPSELRSRILERSEGVPLYAVETVRMLLDRGLLEREGDEYRPAGPIAELEVPETLHSLVAARLDALSAEERSLLQNASVLGKTFTRSALAAVSQRSEADLEPLLGPLGRKEILSLDSDPRSPERGQYAFVQDLLRQVAYDTLPRRERKVRHLAAASHIEELWATAGQDPMVEIVASHVLAALELDPGAEDTPELRARAEASLVKAADRASSLGAPESALRYLEQALPLADSELRRAELDERAGQMAALCDRGAEARTHFERARGSFEELGLTHAAARVAGRLGIHAWQEEGSISEAIAELEQALDVLAQDEPDADVAMLAVSLARPLFFSGRHDEAMPRNELALEIAESLELPEVLSHGLNTKALLLSARGRHMESEVLARRALEVALEHDLTEAAIRAYGNFASILFGRDRLREALDLFLAGRELARTVGDRGSEAWLAEWIRGLRIGLGEWDTVLAEDEALASTTEATRVWQGLNAAYIFISRGELDEARPRLSAAQAEVDPAEPQAFVGVRGLEAELLLAEGRPREALAAAEEALALRPAIAGGLSQMAGALVTGLEAAFDLADTTRVDELLAIVERLPPGDSTPYLRATAARYGSRRAALRGERETADAGFRAAARIYRDIGFVFDLGRTQLDHAEWLAEEGRLDEAEPLAAEAREIFERLRATPYLERLDRLPTLHAAPA